MVFTGTVHNVPNNKRSYSSIYATSHADSMLYAINGWVPKIDCYRSYLNCDNWIVLDLGEPTIITGLAMTG